VPEAITSGSAWAPADAPVGDDASRRLVALKKIPGLLYTPDWADPRVFACRVATERLELHGDVVHLAG
jgi:hypothetical protein